MKTKTPRNFIPVSPITTYFKWHLFSGSWLPGTQACRLQHLLHDRTSRCSILCWDQSPCWRFPAIPFRPSSGVPRFLKWDAKLMPSAAPHTPLLLSTSPTYTTKPNDPPLQCVCSCGNAMPAHHPDTTDSAVLTMPLIWELWEQLLRAGSQLPPANTQPRSSVQCAGPATCWQSICKDITFGTAQNSPGR